MKHFAALLTVALMVFGTTLESQGRGRGGGGGRRGGGGGGGFSRGGGGGFSRPSSPSFSRPSYNRPSRPAPSQRPSYTRPNTRPSTRPGSGNRPSVRPQPGQRPSTQPGTRPGQRPSTRPGTGNRPSVRPQPGTRPSIQPGTRPGQLPSTRPGNRPGSGNRPGQGDRPGLGNRPGTGDRPGQGNRPGLGNRPGGGAVVLPGLGNRPGIGDRPGLGNRPERPNVGDRRDQLQNRLGDRGNNAGDRMANRDRQWNDWHDRHYHHHDHWHHGHWHGYWGPGSRWGYWWNRYPAMTAFGLTTWAINRTCWAFGYGYYVNPYAYGTVVIDNSVYDYSQPIVMTPDESSLSSDPNDSSPAPDVSSSALTQFDSAKRQFQEGAYNAALNSANAALEEMPNDVVIHEFRALVLFALGKYHDAAATLYPVLSVGPGWDWTTMSSLYSQIDDYTDQLRKLEQFRNKNPQDTAAHFLLAYHYITCNHSDAAIPELKQIVAINPKDQLATTLLQQLDPEYEIPEQPAMVKPPEAVAPVAQQSLLGTWDAKRKSGERFQLSLDDKNVFVWKFTTADGKSQEVKGVYAVEKDGVLALEMNDEGTMLAQLDVKGNEMDFYMLGDTQGNEPLHFAKQ